MTKLVYFICVLALVTHLGFASATFGFFKRPAKCNKPPPKPAPPATCAPPPKPAPPAACAPPPKPATPAPPPPCSVTVCIKDAKMEGGCLLICKEHKKTTDKALDFNVCDGITRGQEGGPCIYKKKPQDCHENCKRIGCMIAKYRKDGKDFSVYADITTQSWLDALQHVLQEEHGVNSVLVRATNKDQCEGIEKNKLTFKEVPETTCKAKVCGRYKQKKGKKSKFMKFKSVKAMNNYNKEYNTKYTPTKWCCCLLNKAPTHKSK